ncbi:DNA-processing protein DprA [Curtobacterium sp. RRHDQ10]|uniref:DNA-processing protein DprA n=1 Tax=Curtobacterium phyllosphaerae TaxID=3413379 RepID=UPI003BF1A910
MTGWSSRGPGARALDALRSVRGGQASGADPDECDTHARVVWSIVTEPGDAVAGTLVDAVGAARALEIVLAGGGRGDAPARIADACAPSRPLDDDVVRALGPALARWSPRLRAIDAERVLAAAGSLHAGLIVPGDAAWPPGLDDLGPHAPLVLWVRSGRLRPAAGPAAPLGADGLAVVGSRANTVYGAEMTAEIVSRAADAGLTTVSGGAYGVDAVAHRVALAAGAPTVAVLAGGVDQLYPSGNTDLLRRIADVGAVVAESPPGTRPSRWRFLNRNRVIAAMSRAVIVVEAGHRSGALNTANHAAQLGRPVGAVPGPLTSAASAGCHRLVAAGRATLLCRPSDAIDLVRTLHPGPISVGRSVSPDGSVSADDPVPVGGPVPLDGPMSDPMLIRVLDALGTRQGVPVSEVARRAGVAIADAEDTLALAELVGKAARTTVGWRQLR